MSQAALETITEHVQWERPIPNTQLTYDSSLGFLALESREATDAITVVGFYSPTPAEGSQVADELSLVTKLDQIPEPDRTIDLQGKGVGRRLYNTPHATGGLAHEPREIGAYAFQVDRAKILDTRHTGEQKISGKVSRIAQHAGRMLRSRTQGLEAVVDDLHATYNGYDAVIMSQPPRPAQRQRSRDMGNPVPPAFMLTRRQGLPLPLVGRIVNPWVLKD